MVAKRRVNSPKKRRKSKIDLSNETVDTLGYRRLADGPIRHRIVSFGDVLPDLIAKYGLARKLSIARYETTFRQIVCDLFPQAPLREERENSEKIENKQYGKYSGDGENDLKQEPDDVCQGSGGNHRKKTAKIGADVRKSDKGRHNNGANKKNGEKTETRDLFSDLSTEEEQRKDEVTNDGVAADGGSFGFFNEHSFHLIGFRAGTIEIEVANAPLLSEWTFYKEEILRRFQTALPEEKIRKIRFTLR